MAWGGVNGGLNGLKGLSGLNNGGQINSGQLTNGQQLSNNGVDHDEHHHHHQHHIRYIPLSYSSEDSHDTALALVTQIRPDWATAVAAGLATVEFVRFTDGITNTLLKASARRVGQSKEEADKEAILLRAYGHGTDLLIDRPRETQNHELLMKHGLAPPLLARFQNGMLYRFVRGAVAHPEDLRSPPIYRAIARRLAQWHATVPCIAGPTGHSRKGSRNVNANANMNVGVGVGVSSVDGGASVPVDALTDADFQRAIDRVAPGKPSPNVWTVMQKWIFALPTDTEAQRARQVELQAELRRLVNELSQRPGLGKNGLIFAHCDLLSGNVIVLPKGVDTIKDSESTNSNGICDKAADPVVTFIDYEYATPSPAAFDIANHFAEWGGFDCDYAVLPTRKQRRDFIAEYVRAYLALAGSKQQTTPEGYQDEDECGDEHEDGVIAAASRRHHHDQQDDETKNEAEEVQQAVTDQLLAEVDLFRGVPGFYWAIWALIQATISDIDFDYASYAEVRLGEYYAWRAESDGSRARAGREMPLRERRWAQEE